MDTLPFEELEALMTTDIWLGRSEVRDTLNDKRRTSDYFLRLPFNCGSLADAYIDINTVELWRESSEPYFQIIMTTRKIKLFASRLPTEHSIIEL